MLAYEGYFENGNFHAFGRIISIPERKRTIITVLDEPYAVKERLTSIDDIFALIDSSDEEVPEFERVKFIREVDI